MTRFFAALIVSLTLISSSFGGDITVKIGGPNGFYFKGDKSAFDKAKRAWEDQERFKREAEAKNADNDRATLVAQATLAHLQALSAPPPPPPPPPPRLRPRPSVVVAPPPVAMPCSIFVPHSWHSRQSFIWATRFWTLESGPVPLTVLDKIQGQMYLGPDRKIRVLDAVGRIWVSD